VLLRILAALGCGFDCASRGEIDQIVGNGLAPGDQVIYANPCKTRAYIQHADQMGVRRMTFDSVEELAKVREHHSAPE
jgi:ornithine decarboxylase